MDREAGELSWDCVGAHVTCILLIRNYIPTLAEQKLCLSHSLHRVALYHHMRTDPDVRWGAQVSSQRLWHSQLGGGSYIGGRISHGGSALQKFP